MRRATLAAVFVAALGLAALSEADLPRARPGLWEVTHSANGGRVSTERNCAKEQKDVRPHEMNREECPVQNVSRAPGGFVIDAECARGPMTMKAHVTVGG